MSFCGTAVGRLTSDSEKKMVGDRAVLKFSIASNRPGRNDDVDFYNCEMWVKSGDKRDSILKKGALVAVKGRYQIDKFKTKEGNDAKSHRIVVDGYDGLEFLMGSKNGSSDQQEESNPVAAAAAAAAGSSSDDDEAPF